MKNLIIVCAGGFSREVMWLARDTNQYKIIGVLDDNIPVGQDVDGVPVLGGIDQAREHLDSIFIIATGNPRVRKMIHGKLESLGVTSYATLIHPSVIKSHSVTIGEGSIICAGTVMTVNIQIGVHSIININSTIGHDCKIGNYCTLAPIVAVSGNVTMHERVEVGTGAVIRQGLVLSEGSMLGMGGVLTKPIAADQIFVGNPATFLRSF